MSNSGGISYLLKRGRLPTQPKSVPKYAVGGTPGQLRTVGPINTPLRYGTVPDYEYKPSTTNVGPHYEYDKNGKLVYVPGTYHSGTFGIRRPDTLVAAPAAPVAAPSPYVGGYEPPGNDVAPTISTGGYTPESPLSGAPTTGDIKGDLTLALINAGLFDPALNGTFGSKAQAAAEKALNATTISVAEESAKTLAAAIAADPNFGGGGYSGPGGTTSVTGGNVASKGGMGVDPAQAQGQGTYGQMLSDVVAAQARADMADRDPGTPTTSGIAALSDAAPAADSTSISAAADRADAAAAADRAATNAAADALSADRSGIAALGTPAVDVTVGGAMPASNITGTPGGVAITAAPTAEETAARETAAASRTAANIAAADAALNARTAEFDAFNTLGGDVTATPGAEAIADAREARDVANALADAAANPTGGDVTATPGGDGVTPGGYGGDQGFGGGLDNDGGGRDEARGGLNLNGRYYPPKNAGGIAALAHGGNPRLLSGGGDGLSDGIPAIIGRSQPARLADGEFVVSADVVSALGGGSTKAGSQKLYAMMDRIRQGAHGSKKQVKPINERRVLPA